MLNKLMNRAVISGAIGARTAAPLVGMFLKLISVNSAKNIGHSSSRVFPKS